MACDYCCARGTNETLCEEFANIGNVKNGIRMLEKANREKKL